MNENRIVQTELDLLEGIERNPEVNQATLAAELGVAVGTVNWHLKRLVEKGAIKVKQASRRKLRYLITPEGIALRTHLTLDYVHQSFRLYRLIRSRAGDALSDLRQAGYDQVRIELDGDMADVVRLTCLEQGISIRDDGDLPLLRMEGMKVLVEYPPKGQV